MLSVNWVRLIEGSILTTGVVTYYTAPAQGKAAIKILTLSNNTGTQQTVTLYLVPRNASAAQSNEVGPITVPPNSQIFVVQACHVLEKGDSIQASCSANSAVTIMASGYEFS